MSKYNLSDYFFGLCLLLCSIMLGILLTDTQTKYHEYKVETEAELANKEVYIEQLEKEIRLLKTDLDIKENGFPEE